MDELVLLKKKIYDSLIDIKIEETYFDGLNYQETGDSFLYVMSPQVENLKQILVTFVIDDFTIEAFTIELNQGTVEIVCSYRDLMYRYVNPTNNDIKIFCEILKEKLKNLKVYLAEINNKKLLHDKINQFNEDIVNYISQNTNFDVYNIQNWDSVCMGQIASEKSDKVVLYRLNLTTDGYTADIILWNDDLIVFDLEDGVDMFIKEALKHFERPMENGYKKAQVKAIRNIR